MKDFVTYEQAVKLKELGFDWGCTYFYDEDKKLTAGYADISGDGGFDDYELSVIDLTCSVNNNCLYRDIFDAPTLAQAAKWLREVKGIIIVCTPEVDEYDFNDYVRKFITGQWCYELWRNGDEHWNSTEKLYPTYETALSAGIDTALKLIENKQL